MVHLSCSPLVSLSIFLVVHLSCSPVEPQSSWLVVHLSRGPVVRFPLGRQSGKLVDTLTCELINTQNKRCICSMYIYFTPHLCQGHYRENKTGSHAHFKDWNLGKTQLSQWVTNVCITRALAVTESSKFQAAVYYISYDWLDQKCDWEMQACNSLLYQWWTLKGKYIGCTNNCCCQNICSLLFNYLLHFSE